MVLAAMLFVKHLFADGPLQTPYQVINKGRFLHPAGLLHVGIHAGLTTLCLLIWSLWLTASTGEAPAAASVLVLIVALEFVVHYLTDFAKCQTEARFSWSSRVTSATGAQVLQINSSMFFIAFLTDQTIHSLTYVGIVYLIGVS